MTQPFVSSGASHTDGNTTELWSQQADMVTTKDAVYCSVVNISQQQIPQCFKVLNVKVMEVGGDHYIFYEWKDPGYTRTENIYYLPASLGTR